MHVHPHQMYLAISRACEIQLGDIAASVKSQTNLLDGLQTGGRKGTGGI